MGFILSLLKNSYTNAEGLSIPNLDSSHLDHENSYQVIQSLTYFCKLVALVLS